MNNRIHSAMKNIKILSGNVTLQAVLNDSPTSELIYNALPIEGSVNLWGDEIYFSIPVQTGLESDAREEMAVGELGYWPTGNAFCIFYGPTPASHGEKPVAASAVNIIGNLTGDYSAVREIRSGSRIKIQ